MTSVLRARGATDLIALVPVLLGFRPRESLVAIVVKGPRSQLGFRLRLDLPERKDTDSAAEQVVAYLLQQDPDEVLLIAFSECPDLADPLVARVGQLLDRSDVRVQEALRCDGARYFSYTCQDSECSSPQGVPYDDRSNSMLAEAIYRGVEVLPDREALVERYAKVCGTTRKRMRVATREAVKDLERAARAGTPDLVPQRDPELIRHGLGVVMGIVDRFLADSTEPLTDGEVASLSVWSSLVIVRDCLWTRIEHSTASIHASLWSQVAARVVEPFERAPLALAAFASWLSGNGSAAQCALDRVHGIDPDYSMAALIQRALAGCMDPQLWEGLDIDDVMQSVPGLA